MKQKKFRFAALGAAIGAFLLVALTGDVASATQTDTPTTAWQLAQPVQLSDVHPHMMVIVEENRESQSVFGQPDMPYFNALASKYGEATRWHAIGEPSLPNYLAIVSGSTHGVKDDSSRYSFPDDSLGSQLSTAGIPWAAYFEDLPRPCSKHSRPKYIKTTNPFMFFSQVSDVPSCVDHVLPATMFNTWSLPDFVWYGPNYCNNGHSCPNRTVDNSLKQLIPKVMASDWYRQNGTIFITWDEGSRTLGKEHIAMVVVHETGAPRRMGTPGNHYGLLRTLEESYGLPLLGAAAGATSLQPLITPGPGRRKPKP